MNDDALEHAIRSRLDNVRMAAPDAAERRLQEFIHSRSFIDHPHPRSVRGARLRAIVASVAAVGVVAAVVGGSVALGRRHNDGVSGRRSSTASSTIAPTPTVPPGVPARATVERYVPYLAASVPNAMLTMIGALAVDPAGNVFFVDARPYGGSHADTEIYELRASDGATLRILREPHGDIDTGLVVDASGHLYIGSSTRSDIRRLDLHSGATEVVASAGGAAVSLPPPLRAPAMQAGPISPTGFSLDARDNLYFVDHETRVVSVLKRGVIEHIAGNGVIEVPADTGIHGGPIEGMPATDVSLFDPVATAIDDAGNVFVSDNHRDLVVEVDHTTGRIHVVAGRAGDGGFGYSGDGGAANHTRLGGPGGLAVDGNGNVFIAEGNYAVREVLASTHTIFTVAGNAAFDPGNAALKPQPDIGVPAPGLPALGIRLRYPSLVAFDARGRLVVGSDELVVLTLG